MRRIDSGAQYHLNLRVPWATHHKLLRWAREESADPNTLLEAIIVAAVDKHVPRAERELAEVIDVEESDDGGTCITIPCPPWEEHRITNRGSTP